MMVASIFSHETTLRVITVSLETMKLVRGLPPLDILEDAAPT